MQKHGFFHEWGRGRSFSCQLVVIVIFLLALLTSCTQDNHLKGYVYYRLNANPTTLDPAFIVDVTGGTISAKLFNGLVRLDDKLNVVPDIAESWRISKDGLTYTFRLRKGAYFSNKQDVKASDFKYSFMRILDPATHSPNTWVLEKIAGAHDFMTRKSAELSGIRVLGDYVLEIKLQKRFSPFLYLLTMTAAYVVPENEVKRWGPDFASHPVGTGPFLLAKWLSHRELRLTGRADYFGSKAKVKGIIYRIIPEDLTAMTEFELGNLDVISVPGSQYSRFRKDKKWSPLMSAVEGINTYYLGMNCSRFPFNNADLRRAMNYAIDRRRLLSTFYEKRGRLAAGPVPDVLRKWTAPPLYEYEPERARRMVGQLGLSGTTVHFYITPEQEVVDMAEFIQSYLSKTGLNVRIHQLEWSAYKQAINKGEPDMFWLSWWADYPDPEDFLFPLFDSANIGPAGNRARYANSEVDRLIELGQAAPDSSEGDRYYGRAESIVVRDAPWVFFWHRNDYTVRQPWIKNYLIYPIYSMDKGTDISL